MPFGIHKHSNRSKQALNDSVQGTDSEGSDFNESRSSQPQVFQPQQHQQPYTAQSPQQNTNFDQQTQQAQQKPVDFPARSQSTRHSGIYQPAIHAQATGSAQDLVENRKQQYPPKEQYSQPPPPAEAKKSKGFFDRMRSSSTRNPEPRLPPLPPGAPGQGSYNNKEGLARRASKKEQPPIPRTQRDPQDTQRVDRLSIQGSRHLPTPQEGGEDDGGLDPYLVQVSDQENTQNLQENHQQTIRPVQSESDQIVYPPQTHEQHQQFEAQQQHLREQLQHQQNEAQNYYQPQPQNPAQLQPTVNISPSSFVAGDQYRQQNPETVSQLSYESPVVEREEQQRPVSGQSNGQSPNTYNSQQQDYPSRTTSIPQGPRPLSQYTGPSMPPPAGASANRRPGDSKQALQGAQGQGQPESRDGPPPPTYSRGQFPGNNQPPTPGLSPLPPPPPGGAQGPNYRGGPPQREQFGNTGGGETGRSTPPLANDRNTDELYKELLQKYKKVKSLYFDKTAQVEQLQNTLANQRLSQSRTSLDDSEYMTRFQRLEGAITNLAFNIRKDWRIVPSWLSQSCNQEAMKIGKQEMTAVGRACITKLVVDVIFNHTFHPGLDGDLSYSLKEIEKNIRFNSPPLNNQEESDALTAKVVQWRLSTLEGLKESLGSSESEQHKKDFAQNATSHLAAELHLLLQDPPPAGIEDSCHMIVELAVSIASNIPLESRDIAISYPMPGDMLQPNFMKIENPIPALENPGAETGSDADAASTTSTDRDENGKEDKDGKGRKEKPKGMLQGLMGNSGGNKLSKPAPETSSESNKKLSAEDGTQKVRFAGFVSVEVRGRQVLVKAPVWTIS